MRKSVYPLLRPVAAACLSLALSSPALAQNEAALKSYFEGHRIAVRIDMPGSSEGVDVLIEPARGINYKEYRDDLKKYGTALASGDVSTITQIKLKRDAIEFQIGGGGYGTFGDDTSTSSGIRLLDKTEREKTLEKRIKDETDKQRRRDMQDELDYLRSRRERENRALRMESDRIEEMKRERLAERRLRGGSRFNLRYKQVPANISPEDIVAALREYVDFNPTQGPRQFLAPAADVASLRKGMSVSEVERLFGRALQSSTRRDGDIDTTTAIWDLGEQRLTATFAEDVLVRWTIASR